MTNEEINPMKNKKVYISEKILEKASDKEIEILEKSIADIDFLIKEFGAM